MMQRAVNVVSAAMLFVAYLSADGFAEPPAEPLLSRSSAPPVYVRNLESSSKWPDLIRAGVDEARRYFGSFGPVYVYIVTKEDGAPFHQEFVRTYCRNRQHDGLTMGDCLRHSGQEIIAKALRGRGDAYLSLVMETQPPIAELVFINPQEFRDPYLYTRGIHEYTHVFQRAFPRTSTWLTEGGAEFFACYLGERRGWAQMRNDFRAFMENAARMEDGDLGIEHMEDVDQAPPAIRKFYRQLAYDLGAWAFAFMIHHSKSQRVRDIPERFYPIVRERGWEAALVEFTRFESKQDFYQAFRVFRGLSRERQLAILAELRD